MKKILSCLSFIVFIALNVNGQTFVPLQGDTVVTEYNDGKQWAYIDVNNFVVGLACYEAKDDYGRYYQIKIFINNHNTLATTFKPELITSKLITTKDTSMLKVYTDEAFQKKIKRTETWAMALIGLAAGLNSATAGHTTSYSTTYGSNGRSYTTVTNTYDPNATYQANMSASYQMQTLRTTMENDREIKEQGYLKMTTIHPGESIVGYMNIKLKKGKLLTINVPVNGHLYSFNWDVDKKKK